MASDAMRAAVFQPSALACATAIAPAALATALTTAIACGGRPLARPDPGSSKWTQPSPLRPAPAGYLKLT